MKKDKFLSYLWIAAVASATLGTLGEYHLVVIKGLSNYNFELVLAGFVFLLILKLLKK